MSTTRGEGNCGEVTNRGEEACDLEWFGETIAAQVIANDGKLPLLGTELLVNRKLLVDYVDRTVSIT